MQTVINGLLVNFFKEENADSEKNLLILPGWRRTSAEWGSISQKLGEQTLYNIWVLDLPGFGATPKPSEIWDTYDYTNFTKEFIKKMNISQYCVLGHSFGGRVATILASEATTESEDITEKDRPQKLILLDSAGLEKLTIAKKLKILLFKCLKFLLTPFPSIKTKLQMYLGSTDYKNAGEMREIFKRVIRDDLKDLLPKIEIPTYILWGNKDQILNVKYAQELKQQIKGSVLRIIWGAQHSPHIEKPEKFLEVMKEILE
jgi:pimeloyl-ACP methyl ester carboxylesterase